MQFHTSGSHLDPNVGPDREERAREFVADCPMQRFGTPEEVASLAVLLASDEARYINGAELNIDGGMLAGSIAAPTNSYREN